MSPRPRGSVAVCSLTFTCPLLPSTDNRPWVISVRLLFLLRGVAEMIQRSYAALSQVQTQFSMRQPLRWRPLIGLPTASSELPKTPNNIHITFRLGIYTGNIQQLPLPPCAKGPKGRFLHPLLTRSCPHTCAAASASGGPSRAPLARGLRP